VTPQAPLGPLHMCLDGLLWWLPVSISTLSLDLKPLFNRGATKIFLAIILWSAYTFKLSEGCKAHLDSLSLNVLVVLVSKIVNSYRNISRRLTNFDPLERNKDERKWFFFNQRDYARSQRESFHKCPHESISLLSNLAPPQIGKAQLCM
jgi:hypothetical protein